MTTAAESRVRLRVACVVAVAVVLALPSSGAVGASFTEGPVLYVVTPGHLSLYRIGGDWALLSSVSLPFSDAVRGIDADLRDHALFVSHGGNGGSTGTGALMRIDLFSDSVVWDRTYPFGTDQFAYCNRRIYMPEGENSIGDHTWDVINPGSGDVIGTIEGPDRPHNTICHDRHLFMGGVGSDFLYTRRLQGARRVGPGPSATPGVRPFTVNGVDSRVYLTWTRYRGFSVGDLQTGQILANINFGPIPPTYHRRTASHGISLSPDGSEVYVLDVPKQQVEVWSATDAPTRLAVINLQTPIAGPYPDCTSVCVREGWLLHSLDGRYVFVGDSGDVIDTNTRAVIAQIPDLRNSRHGYLEIDWSGGRPTATTTHFGVGRS